MIKFLQGIWKDPVWSKVISVGILGLISISYLKIESYRDKKPIKQVFEELLSKEVTVKHISIFVATCLTAYLIYKWFKNEKTIKYNEEHRNLDKALFLKIREEILPMRYIGFIREFSFAGNAFRNDSIDAFFKYEHFCEKPDFEFIDTELNKILTSLTYQIKRFLEIISINTWQVNNPNLDANTVPPEWQFEQPERFKKVVREIHDSATEICKNYDNLIKIGKRKLGV